MKFSGRMGKLDKEQTEDFIREIVRCSKFIIQQLNIGFFNLKEIDHQAQSSYGFSVWLETRKALKRHYDKKYN